MVCKWMLIYRSNLKLALCGQQILPFSRQWDTETLIMRVNQNLGSYMNALPRASGMIRLGLIQKQGKMAPQGLKQYSGGMLPGIYLQDCPVGLAWWSSG